MIGQKLGHYHLLTKIGAGGMGEVYRARDAHLSRDVAIKVLPAGTLTDETARRRFRREAEALAKLNHSHIAAVYDFDTQEGLDYLVMEHVEGETLAERLKRGPLGEKELARVGSQVAEGLAEAHEQSVIHRDLKPGNIKLTRKGQVKILDFGIAKLLRPLSEATTESFAQTWGVTGTLPYMSPEQLQGEEVDARSDLYSLGVALYELATGRRPFEQKVSTALSEAILHQPAPSPARLKPDLSPRLEEIILKCLEKDPECRYQSAKELAVDLRRMGAPPIAAQPSRPRRWVSYAGGAGALAAVVVVVVMALNLGGLRDRLLGAATSPRITSLAVLPLENLSGDPEQEYFVDGMHEELIANLAKIAALKVISRTSVMGYKQTRKPLPDIGRELGVDGVIEGSVRRAGDQVRITVQLIHAPSDKHLWAQSYDGDLSNVLALQGDVARAVAREIQVQLTPQEQARLASTHVVNPAAHEAYLKGRYYLRKRSRAGFTKSREYFEQAIAEDPSYAPAYAGLVQSYRFAAARGFLDPKEAWPKAKSAAERALELDSALAETHTSLGLVHLSYEWDWAAAEKEFRRGVELSPSDADAHVYYATYLRFLGRFDESIQEVKRAQELDPLRLDLAMQLGMELVFARRYDEAIAQLQKVLELDPNHRGAPYWLVAAYGAKGLYNQAAAEQMSVLNRPEDKILADGFERTYKAQGYKAAMRLLDQNALDHLRNSSPLDSWSLACANARLGNREETFKWLEKAYADRHPALVQLKVDPDFAPLRSDPRFLDLLRRMNFPP